MRVEDIQTGFILECAMQGGRDLCDCGCLCWYMAKARDVPMVSSV